MRTVNEGIIGEFGQEVSVSVKKNAQTIATNTDLSGIKIYFDTNLFKTVMQALEFTATKDISLEIGDEIAVEATFTLDDDSTSVNFGAFFVDRYETDVEMGTTKYYCYDAMVKTLENYEVTEVIVDYPCTISQFLTAIATKLGFTVVINNRATILNGNKTIADNLYDGNYTYRDILEQIAEATASIIAIRNNAITVIYPSSQPIALSDDGLSGATVKETYSINSVVLSRGDVEDSVIAKDDEKIAQNGLKELKFNNNQIMDSTDDSVRLEYAQSILDQVKNYAFVEYDADTFGIVKLEAGDVFSLTLADHYVEKYDDDGEVIEPTYTTYTCIMVSDEIDLSDGITEKTSFAIPQASETDYSIGAEAVELARRAYVKVNKQENYISSFVQDVTGELNALEAELRQTSEDITARVTVVEDGLAIQQTALIVTADEVKVTHEQTQNPSNYVGVRGDGLRIYVDGSVMAQATNEAFITPKLEIGADERWSLQTSNGGDTLNFFRR